ncbi:hypothetical protein BDP55DRAFT_715992 [Colletotrichum godetiae]|uniref:AttH domain-containing protein n=1 Tax=Colletotrichum godetiae TaxID=1209918 RepID=A0AAJ0ETE3_9PEZI|nr:uncharacterized protein BDP55DRAFT_715992 [Colletotrichum godetiae]KAK1674947.1 hypothetical protein BDP55DRAFT_715992 [Colletotrichum godetiae]
MSLSSVSAHEQHPEHSLSTTKVEEWEDSLRTDPSQSGVFEWWYFDSHLANGGKLMVVFHTKLFTSPQVGLEPKIQVQLETPDGRVWNMLQAYDPSDFRSSRVECDVTIANESGVNFFRGTGLKAYHIRVAVESLDIDIRMTSTTSPWRPGQGCVWSKEDEYFDWFVAVPQGKVTATYTIAGESPVTVEGDGYHDKNWGNAPLTETINHWYWGRGTLGPYTVISSANMFSEKHGSPMIKTFMVQNGDTVVADDASKVSFTADGIEIDDKVDRPVADTLRFGYRNDGTVFSIEYFREETTMRQQMGGGWYLRFAGGMKLKKYQNDELVEEHVGHTQWDSMWFGQGSKETLPYGK